MASAKIKNPNELWLGSVCDLDFPGLWNKSAPN